MVDVHVKLADYGVSRSVLPWGTKGLAGTPPFMAPEIIQHKGEETYTEKVRLTEVLTISSQMGVICMQCNPNYEMLVGAFSKHLFP